MPPGITFEDGPLLAAVCNTLGIAHPPGYPLYALSCAPISWLAQAAGTTPARGAAWASALAAAAACAILLIVLRRELPQAAALAGAGAWGLATLMWNQAVIPEVYALNSLLCVATLAVCDGYVRRRRRRLLLAAALLAGLGLANHWPLYLLALPVFVLWLLAARQRLQADLRDGPLAVGCLLLFGLGLLPYLHLLFAPAEATKFLGPVSLEQFAGYVARSYFSAAGDSNGIPRWDERLVNAGSTLSWLPASFSALGGWAGIAGLVLLAARASLARRLAFAWGLTAPTLFLALWRPHLAQSEHSAAIYQAYPLVALMMFAMAIAVALAEFQQRLGGRDMTSVVIVLLASLAYLQWPATDRSADAVAASYVRLALAELPPAALVLTGSTSYAFPLRFRAGYLPADVPRREDLEVVSDYRYLAEHGFERLSELPALLGRESRPVAADMFLPGIEASKQVEGAWFRMEPAVLNPGPVLSPRAREYYRLLRDHGLSARNTWTAAFARRQVFELIAAHLSAHATSLPQTTAEDAELFRSLAATVPGRFARLRHDVASGQKPSATLAAILRFDRVAQLPSEWQADVWHMAAVAYQGLGDVEQARIMLEKSLATYPVRENERALADLLILYVRSGDMAAYIRLRQRYAGYRAAFLPALDEFCATASGHSCAPGSSL